MVYEREKIVDALKIDPGSWLIPYIISRGHDQILEDLKCEEVGIDDSESSFSDEEKLDKDFKVTTVDLKVAIGKEYEFNFQGDPSQDRGAALEFIKAIPDQSSFLLGAQSKFEDWVSRKDISVLKNAPGFSQKDNDFDTKLAFIDYLRFSMDDLGVVKSVEYGDVVQGVYSCYTLLTSAYDVSSLVDELFAAYEELELLLGSVEAKTNVFEDEFNMGWWLGEWVGVGELKGRTTEDARKEEEGEQKREYIGGYLVGDAARRRKRGLCMSYKDIGGVRVWCPKMAVMGGFCQEHIDKLKEEESEAVLDKDTYELDDPERFKAREKGFGKGWFGERKRHSFVKRKI